MTKPAYRILVGVNFSDFSRGALDAALDEAFLRDASEVHLATVLDHNGHVPDPTGHGRATAPVLGLAEAASLLHDLLSARLTERGAPRPLRAFTHVRTGTPERALLDLAADIEPDLIVVGTHGRTGFGRLFVGSVAERVMRAATCPVLVVRPKLEPEPAPPQCDACRAMRAKSEGAEWWCPPHHPHRKERAHTYHYSSVFDQSRDRAHPIS